MSNFSNDEIESQLETILRIETKRLYEKVEEKPLAKEEVQKLDLLISINEKLKLSRLKSAKQTKVAETVSAADLLKALRDGQD